MRVFEYQTNYTVKIDVDVIYKESKEEKVDIKKAALANSNCFNNAELLDKLLLELLNKYYKENFFRDKMKTIYPSNNKKNRIGYRTT